MDVQNLEKNQRNKIIKELCDQGAGFSQLVRITGISYGIIQRVGHIFYKTTMINLHACYCALFADIEQKSPFLFAGIK